MFKYLVCIDFEATCWPGSNWSRGNSEIIDIGAYLVNLDNGTIEDRFQCYVRPTRSPKLTDFCIKFTGIRQSLIDRQETFPNVYLELANWIQRIEREKSLRFASPSQRRADGINGINATFCSWSDTDLKTFFKQECKRSNISALPCFKTWIDARQIFNQKYALGRCKFSQALQHAGIHTVEPAHSAINDAKNLANLVVHLSKRGAQFIMTTNCCDHSTPTDCSY